VTLSRGNRVHLEIQRAVSYCLFVFFGPAIKLLSHYYFRYRVEDLKEIRDQYRTLQRQTHGALIVCTNHLTFVDSLIQGVILNSMRGYLRNFSSLPWNLPESTNFEHSLTYRVICYLGKSIPVTRRASPEESRRTVSKMQYVLARGDNISVFPEGKRSRDGRVDDEDFSYGAGQLLANAPEAHVLCVYMRGMKFGGFAQFPQKGEKFYFQMALFEPKSELKGLRWVRDVSTQIVGQLKAMEDEYLSKAEGRPPTDPH
jgi:1-acyl-sn-glycerol-3-phosphate acyltransferase